MEAMLDTGFNGYLKLPSLMIAALGLSFERDAVVMLADDSVVTMPQYQGWVDWHGDLREVLVLEAAGGLLVGMALPRGSRVTLDVLDGAAVRIEPIDA